MAKLRHPEPDGDADDEPDENVCCRGGFSLRGSESSRSSTGLSFSASLLNAFLRFGKPGKRTSMYRCQ